MGLKAASPARAAQLACESFLDQLFSRSRLIIALRDVDGRFLRVSRRLARLFAAIGVDPLGRTVAEVLPAPLARRIEDQDRRILQSGRCLQGEEEYFDGTVRRIYLASGMPLLAADGTIGALFTIATDVTAHRRNEEALRNAALAVSGAHRGEVFDQLVRFLAATLNVDLAFVSALDDARPDRARIVAGHLRGRMIHDLVYSLPGTPCEKVFEKPVEFIPRDVRSRFPADSLLVDNGLESYAACALYDSGGRPIGLVAVSHGRALVNRPVIESMLRIYAVRAAAELERLRAERELRVSEANYRQIFESAEDAIFVHDFDTGAILDVNPKACASYGYTLEEMRSLDVGAISSGVPPYTGAHAASLIERARRGEKVRTEWHRRNKDGSLRWDEVVIHRAELAGQKRIVVFTRDITEIKARVDALRASEEQYRSIFNASADGMILFDGAGRIVDVNHAVEAMYGYGREELIGMDPHQRFHPDAWPVLERFLRRVKSGWFFKPSRTGRPLVEETREVTKDGRILELEAHLVPMRYQGRPHVLAIKRDITDRKSREEELRKSEDRLRATVTAALDCIVSMDADGNVIGFNPAAEACFGYRREDIIGKPLADLIVPPSLRAAHEQGMQHYRRTGEGPFLGKRIEINAMRSDGSEFPVELAIAASRGPRGDIFVGYLRDISDKRRSEAEQARLEAQLRQAQKMEAIGHLTGGIAHDFNNILTSILGYTTMGLEHAEAAGDEKIARYLQQVRSSGERARDLIRQMLTFSRGQRGEARPMALARRVEEAISLFRSTFPSSISFDIRADAGAPPVTIDPIQFEQVLMNLCINARDAMRGSGEIAIRVSTRSFQGCVCASCRQDFAGEYVELLVEDTGSGIAPHVMESMFEPFYTTKEVGQGSGMGLSTTHGIVHEYGGHMVVENRDEGGARFSVLFPSAPGSATSDASATARAAETVRDGFAAHVLVVDDETTVREFLGELLRSRGLSVRLARDGLEALELLSADDVRCDVVITDQTMPHLSGVELARRLKGMRPALPVILVSGFSEVVSGRSPVELGVEAIMAKPVDHVELLRQVRVLVEVARTGRADEQRPQ